jgi:hypothetical protein
MTRLDQVVPDHATQPTGDQFDHILQGIIRLAKMDKGEALIANSNKSLHHHQAEPYELMDTLDEVS